MIPNSDNTAPVAVTTPPDWGKGVSVTFVHQTQVFVARSGKEQRQRGRAMAKAKLSYKVSGLTTADQRAAMLTAEVEALRLCIVPFWCEGTQTITSIVADVVTIGVDPRKDFFIVGQYVYLDDGTTQDFRQIASITDRILTLVTDGTAPAFGAGARIYPCRKCRRVESDEMLSWDDSVSHTLNLEYETVE